MLTRTITKVIPTLVEPFGTLLRAREESVMRSINTPIKALSLDYIYTGCKPVSACVSTYFVIQIYQIFHDQPGESRLRKSKRAWVQSRRPRPVVFLGPC